MNDILQRIDVDGLLNRFVAFLPSAVAALLVLLVFWVVYRVTRTPLNKVLQRAGIAAPLIHMLVDNVYRFAILAVALVMAADQIGINVAAAVAGLGVAGIAIGFAAQDSLANTIAGFLIFWDKPFLVGDWVTVADLYGRVSEITMRTTRIRTNNNTYVVIPNKTIIDEVLVNHSKHGETRIDVPVGIAYKESVSEARRVLLEAIRGLEGVIEKPAPDVVMTELANSSVNLSARVWIDDAALEAPVYCSVMEASKVALDEAGIQIPYHHLQLFLDDVEDRVWDKLGALSGGRG